MSLFRFSVKERKLIKNKKQKEKEPHHELPLDVLPLITKKLLYIKDLSSFGQVCKDWRSTWCDFMASDSPLILQKTNQVNRSCFFYSIPESRTYRTLLPSCPGFSLKGFSSGYMIMIGDYQYLLINPFTGKVIKIPQRNYPFKEKLFDVKPILAFDEANPEEFILVIVARSKNAVLVYQSRNSNWTIVYQSSTPNRGSYSRDDGTSWKLVHDVVVFQKTIYAITGNAEIGVLMFNTKRLKFLYLRNKPSDEGGGWFELVNSNDDQFLVMARRYPCFKTYLIDFSTMSWIKLKTLGDCSLFLGNVGHCYSLSNPSKWGFQSNCVYDLSTWSPRCWVNSMDKLIELIVIPKNPDPNSEDMFRNFDWCFRPRRDIVDYSNLRE